MGAKSSAMTDSDQRTLVITRVFDAPRSLVFKAWTHPDHLTRWWGPHGFTVLSCSMDFRVGGGWSLSMRSPAGVVDRQRGVFREIVEPERLVFTYAFEDEHGKRGHETIVTLSFADLGSKTELTLRQAVFEAVAVRDDHVRGWGEALDHLADYVTKA
jgi:uncharacterized protein YndB with AHSA1/START domain